MRRFNRKKRYRRPSSGNDEPTGISGVVDTVFETTDWTEATHSNDVDPNHDEVFVDTAVKRLDFVVSADRWQSMLDDMTDKYGEFGPTQGQGPDTGSGP